MFSPMFDGQYRSKPQISLRGASRQEGKDRLLQRTHQQREERELVRRKLQAAVTIQAFYRGHTCRQRLYGQLRAEFDSESVVCSSPSEVLALSRLLLIFHHRERDRERLVKLCQKWLHFRRELIAESCSSAICAFHLRRMLSCCCLSLSSLPARHPLALPLRMLEVFLQRESYPTEHRSRLMAYLNTHLVRNGYFKSLRCVLEQRVPPPEGASPTPSPLATSLLDYLTRPLLSGWNEDSLYVAFASELLSPLTPHVCYLVLPHLLTFDLPLEGMIHAILGVVERGSVAPTPELLYAILQMVHSRLDSLLRPSLAEYLRLLVLLLSHAPHRSHMTLEEWAGPDEDDVIAAMEGDPLSSQEELVSYCVATVAGSQLALRIRVGELSAGVLEGLCGVCHQLVSHLAPLPHSPLLQHLALTPSLLSPLWTSTTTLTVPRSFGAPVLCVQQLAKGLSLPAKGACALVEHLNTFCTLFSIYLSTLHDAEFYRETKGGSMPFSVTQLVEMSGILRDSFLSLHMEKHLPPSLLTRHTPSPIARPTQWEWQCLKQSIHRLLCQLYERDSRQSFSPIHHWEVLVLPKIPLSLFLEGEEDAPPLIPPSAVRNTELLRMTPFVFPFIARVKFFQELVALERRQVQGQLQDFLIGPGLHISARRNHIYEDAFSELAHAADLRQKLRVNLVNVQGLDEPGIDGGGVFREFLSELLRTGFDPNHGFFCTTPDGLLYPNPQVHLLNDDYAIHYQFLGGMLGKALYENLLVELPFAGFFLCKLVDRGRGLVGTHHLASLDPELYRNLLYLKHYEGDIEDLSLNFTVVNSEFGQSRVVELKPGGAEIPVTRTNYIEYIHLVAHYRLNVAIEHQFQAFRRGVSAVVPLKWLRLFSQGELQMLISGTEVPIDVQDFRANTKYQGEYSADHEYIKMFWLVVEGFSEQKRRQLLKFVTSCSRPPLLGFRELHPPFCVMSGGQEDRLPSASTCMNILKLPMYPDMQTMRNRLTYAISSGAGFELS